MNKKTVLFTLVTILVITLQAQGGTYGGGDGTAANPYQIWTAEQMNSIGNNPSDWDKHFKLMADIDLGCFTGMQFNIIGAFPNNPFSGVFDGNMHTISKFTYNSQSMNCVGLFACVDDPNACKKSRSAPENPYIRPRFVYEPDAEIRNLHFVDPNVDGGTGEMVGSLVGILFRGSVSNCSVESGIVSGNNYVGGLVGKSLGKIEGSSSFVTVLGSKHTGGLVGFCASETPIEPCSALSYISNCSSGGSVLGCDYTGGLVGGNGGLCCIKNCYSVGNILGKDYVGGIAGMNGCAGIIRSCYSACQTAGEDYIGGLVGQNAGGKIDNSHSSGQVIGDRKVGGLVGNNGYLIFGGTIRNCYSTGLVSGHYDTGGLVGHNGDTVAASFWDIQSTGQSESDGGQDKMTHEMKTKRTFTDAGWDFVGETANGTDDIWNIHEGLSYPFLWWENSIPVADAGVDQTVFVCFDGMAEINLDGSGSYDADGDELEYFWFEGDEQIATGVDPNIELGIGEHTIELIVSDGQEDSEPNEVVITVIGPVEADVHIVPRVINRANRMKRIIAIIRLPEGISKRDISDEPFVLYVTDLDDGIETVWQRVVGWRRRARVFALFDKDELLDIVPGTGRVELTVVGKFKSGQCIYGTDTVRIIGHHRRWRPRFRR